MVREVSSKPQLRSGQAGQNRPIFTKGSAVRVNAYIGVTIPGVLELGRQALIGMRAWCDANPQIGLSILSEYGGQREYLNLETIQAGSLIGNIAFFLNKGLIDDFHRISPHLVCVSNRDLRVGVPRVVNDDVVIGRMGVDYFYNRGYRTIAFLGRDDMGFSVLREQGYRARMEDLGMPCHVFEFRDLDSRLIENLLGLDSRVAVFCAADNLARELIQTLETPLTTVPSQMAVLGVDDDTLQNALSPVSLSSIRLSGERIGYEAAELIYRMHRGEKPPTEPILIQPQSIVTRRSTNALAVEDELVLRVMRFIHNRVADFPDVPALLKEVKVSRRTLQTRFRAATGRSLLQELTDARINKARDLLTTTQLSMKEIADLLGLIDQRQFSLMYKRGTGESPTEYRQRVQPS
jgi:LacI family transcriptional regulator